MLDILILRQACFDGAHREGSLLCDALRCAAGIARQDIAGEQKAEKEKSRVFHCECSTFSVRLKFPAQPQPKR